MDTGAHVNRCLVLAAYSSASWGYWRHRADEGHGNHPQGSQELLVVRDKVGRPQVSLG